ncbi:MAG: hypothetical protein V9H26_22030 [Verrucomicrobiota bacterium]
MHLLYPKSPLHSKQPDEQFEAEVNVVRSAGFEVSLFSLEDFQSGTFRSTPPLPVAAEILYRGWMFSAAEYEALVSAISSAGAHPVTDSQTYLASHHLPNWYPALSDLTPETRVYPPDCDLETELRALDWPEYFIKDLRQVTQDFDWLSYFDAGACDRCGFRHASLSRRYRGRVLRAASRELSP